jgi:hypothetical protein
LARQVVCFATPVRDRWRLQCEPNSKLLERIYLFKADAQFRDLSQQHGALQSWKKLKLTTEGPTRVAIPLADQMVNDWVKNSFERPGVLWSLPTAVVDRISASSPDSAQLRKPEGYVELPSLSLRVDKCIELARVAQEEPRDNVKYFSVVTARPENKKLVLASHLTYTKSLVACMDSSRTFFWFDVLSLSLDELARLRMWENTSDQASASLQPTVWDHLSMVRSLLEDDEFDPVLLSSLSKAGADAVVVELLRLGALIGKGTPAPVASLLDACPAASSLLIDELASCNALAMSDDEFGDLSVALQSDRLVWYSVMSPGNPIDFMKLPLPIEDQPHAPKLALVMDLHRRGWSLTDGVLAPYTLGGPKRLARNMISRAKEYLVALVAADDIFGKGAPRIDHGKPQAYYKCLLKLEALAPIFALLDFERFGNAQFEALFHGKELPPLASDMPAMADMPPVLALEDVQDADDDDDLEMVDLLGRPVAEEIYGGGDAPVFGLTANIVYGANHVKFDNFSHASGNQRGYIKCSSKGRHPACFKYSQVNLYESHKHCAAFLFAWDEKHTLDTKVICGCCRAVAKSLFEAAVLLINLR